MNTPILELSNVSVRFGGLTALDNISLRVERGEALGLIGPNGAGKSTAFNVISGAREPTSGTVHFDGQPTQGKSATVLARAGMGRTFQHVRLFHTMSALENVLVSSTVHYRSAKLAQSKSLEALASVGMEKIAHENAGTLPLGYQKLVAIARCLVADPKLLLLDEMMSGLSDKEIGTTMTVLDHLRSQGMSLVVIEHIMSVMDRISDRVIVFSNGQILAEGTSAQVQQDKAVQATYLGTVNAQH
jgi:branched-chain amino acid transport system ATP-binding protein